MTDPMRHERDLRERVSSEFGKAVARLADAYTGDITGWPDSLGDEEAAALADLFEMGGRPGIAESIRIQRGEADDE